MVIIVNISCIFEKASCTIFFVRAVTVKSLYTLRRRNKVKYIVSTVDTIKDKDLRMTVKLPGRKWNGQTR